MRTSRLSNGTAISLPVGEIDSLTEERVSLLRIIYTWFVWEPVCGRAGLDSEKWGSHIAHVPHFDSTVATAAHNVRFIVSEHRCVDRTIQTGCLIPCFFSLLSHIVALSSLTHVVSLLCFVAFSLTHVSLSSLSLSLSLSFFSSLRWVPLKHLHCMHWLTKVPHSKGCVFRRRQDNASATRHIRHLTWKSGEREESVRIKSDKEMIEKATNS